VNLTGSHINYYFICKRKLWLFAHSIQMEQESENVKVGKLISESSYQRKRHEVEIGDEIENIGAKIDFYDKQTNTIHEIKKTDSFQQAHVWQVLYYIHVLKQKG
jgi:CRISPR-associated exonuclease Cas4